MPKYFTFFFCGNRWKSQEIPLAFTKWLVRRLQPRSPLVIIARGESDYNNIESSVTGNYLDYESRLGELSFDSLRIANRTFAAEGTELHVCFEKVHRIYTYEEGQPLQDGSARLRASLLEDGLKIFTFSIRLDLWNKAELGIEIFPRVEQLFIDLGCTYAYGNRTPHVITGRTSLICGNSRPGYPRIVDFDYAKKIEWICRANYLSRHLLQKLPPMRPQVEGVRFVDLKDDGRSIGSALYVDDDHEQMHKLEEYLSPILWRSAS